MTETNKHESLSPSPASQGSAEALSEEVRLVSLLAAWRAQAAKFRKLTKKQLAAAGISPFMRDYAVTRYEDSAEEVEVAAWGGKKSNARSPRVPIDEELRRYIEREIRKARLWGRRALKVGLLQNEAWNRGQADALVKLLETFPALRGRSGTRRSTAARRHNE